MLEAILLFALIGAVSPPSCELPTLDRCSLAHGFVIGQAPFFPGTIEIWKCTGQTVATLNQIRDLPEGDGPLIRHHFCPRLGPNERLMGCRGDDENFDGTVAITSASGGNRPELKAAWVADTGQWRFNPSERSGLICNRGLTAN